MKITKADWHRDQCDGDCEKIYCARHRLIYFWCQTARPCGGAHYDGGECPECKTQIQRQRHVALFQEVA